MRLFWWQQLPLLILIQLLESSSTSHKIYAETLLAYKSTLVSPRYSGGRIGRFPCMRQQPCLRLHEPKDPGVVSLRIAASVDGDSSVPTLTPQQEADDQKSRQQRVAAIVGGVGAALLVIVIVVLMYICLMRVKRFIRRTSDGESSVPSPSVELGRGDIFPYANVVSPNGTQNIRQLTISELKHATCNFSQSNIVGEGAFGLIYKGLLQDGSMVAIKRHLYTPIRNFLHEVKNIARIHHRHLVKLIGFYEDNHQRLLVYDYIPNGNVGNHLYDSEGLPIGRLNMRQRLLIALGAARGLEHLHSLVPPLFHMHFRTSNVLLDETFTPKVSDYGLHKLLVEDRHTGSSSAIDCFLDPELNSSKNFSAMSDVYSFGVFLLELISGYEAEGTNQSNSEHNIVLQAKRGCSLDDYMDKTLGDQTADAAREIMGLALQCIDISRRRPSMRRIVEELERVQEGEIGRLHSEFGEDIGAAFGEDFLEDKLKPFFKSEPIPGTNDGDVKIVVGNNFDDIVLDESKDVLLMIHVPWCDHYQALEPNYNQLAKYPSSIKSVVVAKMDGTTNEHPKAKIKVEYTDRTVMALFKLLKKHASMPSSERHKPTSAIKNEAFDVERVTRAGPSI